VTVDTTFPFEKEIYVMMKPFLRVLSIDEVAELTRLFPVLAEETVALDQALFRVLSASIATDQDLPPFDRSTMDGYAVRAADTFGVSEGSPGLFTVIGEAAMGQISSLEPGPGQAVRIWTGGALPSTCDAVVMIEHTSEVDESTIEVYRPVAPYDHVVRAGEDFRACEILLTAGHRLRPQDLGFLAALGLTEIKVHRKPRVALISTGDEIVPADSKPGPGCVRDINRHSLHGMCIEAHATPLWTGISPDRLEPLRCLMDKALMEGDIVVISGGSSMGRRDLVLEVISDREDSEILCHGVSVSPGKPLIMARVGSTPVFGLPGHPVSAMVCFEQFVCPVIRRVEGETVWRPFPRPTMEAKLSRNLPSREGRTDFVRVRIRREKGELLAIPVQGKSGMISAMVRAHGCIRVSAGSEGLYKGDHVVVHLFTGFCEEPYEKTHLSQHETAERGAGRLFEPARSERLSRA
jgi:molybdopterin molybdotransferase